MRKNAVKTIAAILPCRNENPISASEPSSFAMMKMLPIHRRAPKAVTAENSVIGIESSPAAKKSASGFPVQTGSQAT